MEEKRFTISLTRTNKLLSRLKNKFTELTASNDRFSKGPQIRNPIRTVSLLTYDRKTSENALEDTHQFYRDYILINNLIEKIKMRLFAANAQYGVHEILATINSLKAEKKMYNSILSDIRKTNVVSLETADILSRNVEAKSSYDIHLSALSVDEVLERIGEIDTELSALDELKDQKNISSSITFTFNNDELKYLHL